MLSFPKHQDKTFSESLTSPLIIGENKQIWDVESPSPDKEDTSHIKVATALTHSTGQ